MTRKTLLNAIYYATPRDYRGKVGKYRAILILRPEGTCLVPLTDLFDHEISRLLDSRKAQEYLQAIRKDGGNTSGREII